MLKSLKVEKHIVATIPSTVETWKAGFDFTNLEDHDNQSLSMIQLRANYILPPVIFAKIT